ncbi:MAG: hypothetical protein RQ756_08045 [Flavobacteriaceae bacterium]|nr:hypothetical protein [Flavobacteriaceae bacterium]
MFLLILSLLYFSSIVFPLGYGLASWMKVKVHGFVTPALLGLIVVMLIAGFYAIWFPLDARFSLILLVISLGFWLKHYQSILLHFAVFAKNFSRANRSKKIFWWLTLVTAFVWASTTNFIYDHETYYIQTQQWLETYGLVPGLANLHVLLGQHSLWHIAQTALKLPELEAYGFYLNCWLWLLCVADINFLKYKLLSHQKLRAVLNVALLPLLFFIGTASTDLPVYIFSTVVFLQWIQVFIFQKKITHPQLAVLFALVAVLIKPTAVAILLPALHLNLTSLFKPAKILFLSGLLGTVFLVKNYIVTGYLLFPLDFNFWMQPDWQLPIEVLRYFNRPKPLWHDFVQEYSSAYQGNRLLGNIQLLLKAFAYILALISAILFMLWVWFQRSIKLRKALLFFICFAILIAVFSVFNFRFVAHWWLFMALIFFAGNAKSIKAPYALFITGFSLALAVPMLFTNNIYRYLYNKNTSIFSADCKTMNTNGFLHKALDGEAYFWETSDCDLPTVNTAQLDYFRKYFKVQPKLRSEALKDGFTSEIVD